MHNFCEVLDFAPVDDTDEQTVLPFPVDEENQKRPNIGQQKKYEMMVNKKRKAVQLKDMGLKCVVSDYALAHWYAQTFKLDINNLPTNAGRDNTAIGKVC